VSLYARALRHAWRMVGVLGLAVLLVLATDWFYGHSSLAFAAAILMLILANAPMLRFNCGRCGKNAFFRGPFVVPWPQRTCGRCGLDLAAEPSQNR
jgi:ribosomal protein S27AE